MDTGQLKWTRFPWNEINGYYLLMAKFMFKQSTNAFESIVWWCAENPRQNWFTQEHFDIFSKNTGNHYQSLDIWANVMKKSVVFFRLKNVMFNYCIWFKCNQQCFQIKLHCIQRTQIMLSAYALQPNCLFYIACSRQQHSIKWLVFNLSLSLFFLYSLSFQNNQLIL